MARSGKGGDRVNDPGRHLKRAFIDERHRCNLRSEGLLHRVRLEIIRRANDRLPHLRHAHRDHVFLDELAHPNPASKRSLKILVRPSSVTNSIDTSGKSCISFDNRGQSTDPLNDIETISP